MCTLAAEAINAISQQGRIYEVGGAVRDRFLKRDRDIKDRDYLVTGLPYDDLSRLLRRFGQVNMVGKSFGVIKFTPFHDDEPITFDISLPRKEYSTGQGHRDFHVAFDPNLPVEVDLKRRDFTINAMAVALDDNRLVDPLSGMADLENKLIRMVTENSFVEDPLRMLRAVQFAARFEFEIEEKTYAAMKEHAALLATISPERIQEELNKLLVKAARPSIGFHLMQKTGLLPHCLPELEACVGVEQPGGYHAYNVFDHILHTIDAAKPRLRLRLAALFHDIRKPQHKREVDQGATFYGHDTGGARTARAVMKRLRYPNDLIKQVEVLVDRHMFTTDVTDKGMRRLIRRVGPDLIFDLLDLRRADVVAQGKGGTTEDVDEFEQAIRDEIERKPPFGLKDLAINGNDIMELLDVSEGKVVGRILDHLLEHVLDYPENNTRENLESLAKEFYLYNIERNDLNRDKGANE